MLQEKKKVVRLQHSSLAARLALRLISGILTLYEYSLCDWPTFSE
jgi:hypothetical protein